MNGVWAQNSQFGPPQLNGVSEKMLTSQSAPPLAQNPTARGVSIKHLECKHHSPHPLRRCRRLRARSHTTQPYIATVRPLPLPVCVVHHRAVRVACSQTGTQGQSSWELPQGDPPGPVHRHPLYEGTSFEGAYLDLFCLRRGFCSSCTSRQPSCPPQVNPLNLQFPIPT